MSRTPEFTAECLPLCAPSVLDNAGKVEFFDRPCANFVRRPKTESEVWGAKFIWRRQKTEDV